MSQEPFSQPNPYASPVLPPTVRPWQSPENKRPTLCTVMFIIDLIFCAIRVPLVFIGFWGIRMVEAGQLKLNIPLELLWWEVYTGVGIVIFGLLANILLLNNKRIGVLFGFIAIMAALASLVVGLAEMSAVVEVGAKAAEESARQAGAVIGLVFRLGINVLYLVALLKFSAWHASRAQASLDFNA